MSYLHKSVICYWYSASAWQNLSEVVSREKDISGGFQSIISRNKLNSAFAYAYQCKLLLDRRRHRSFPPHSLAIVRQPSFCCIVSTVGESFRLHVGIGSPFNADHSRSIHPSTFTKYMLLSLQDLIYSFAGLYKITSSQSAAMLRYTHIYLCMCHWGTEMIYAYMCP